MKLFLIDDDARVYQNILTCLQENGYDVESYLYENRENDENELKRLLQNLTDKDYILIDLYLDEQAERALTFNEILSVKMVSGLKLPMGHVIFYSNGNEREIDPLFAIVPGCHYLPINGEAFNRSDKNRYDRYENFRKDFFQKLEKFTEEH